MEILFVYFILVLVVAAIGSSRGRGFGTFIVSLLLSPIIGLVWAFSGVDSTKMMCPECKELVHKEALVCRYCGQELK